MDKSCKFNWEDFKKMDKAERLDCLRASLLVRIDEPETTPFGNFRDSAAGIARAYVEVEKLDQEGDADFFGVDRHPDSQVPTYVKKVEIPESEVECISESGEGSEGD